MKKQITLLSLLSFVLLTACDFNFSNVVTYQKTLRVYDLDARELTEENNDLKNAYIKDIDARFIKEEDYIPYLSIAQYASLYESHYRSGVYNDITTLGNKIIWDITSGSSLYFRASIDTYEKNITKMGDIQNAFKDDDNPRDIAALNYGLKMQGESLTPTLYAEKYDYRTANIKRFSVDKEAYFPLGFLDLTFSYSSGVYFTYNYQHIFETHDVENYSDKTFKENDRIMTFDQQMRANSDLFIPSYLADYNANLFIYLMDNFYGLKDILNISSMRQYFKNLGYLDALYKTSNAERNYAYSYLLNSFDDHHTILVSQNGAWGEEYPARRGENVNARNKLNAELTDIRNRYYASLGKTPNKDIIFSDDEQTAMFMFDRFFYGESQQVFNKDGSVKEDAGDHDHYFQILNVLNDLKNNHPTVKNVILDIATNGGGVVGVMLKLLALLSKDNYCPLYLYTDTSGEILRYQASVDINRDGLYNSEDCFGNIFNFYILTSDCSFSCGNAFPCTAQIEGLAQVIGQTSGGGECAVAVHYLPNSEYVYHSSNLHLGTYDEDNKKFIGFENGAIPDYEIKEIDDSFFDINKLNALIK